MENETWKLARGRLSDGAETLILLRNEEIFCHYAQGKKPHDDLWHVYYKTFPKAEFKSRDACIRNAETIAGRKLSIK